MNKKIARNIDEPAKLIGFTPLELAALGITFAILSTLLRGVPYSALLCLLIVGLLGGGVLTLNRTFPPMHGLYHILKTLRVSVTPVMLTELSNKNY